MARESNKTVTYRRYTDNCVWDTSLSYDEFVELYKDNINNAYENWLVKNEESLPVSVIGDTADETHKNMYKYFLKNFIINFNTYAYRGYIGKIDNADGYCLCRCYNSQTDKIEAKKLQYIHVLAVR